MSSPVSESTLLVEDVRVLLDPGHPGGGLPSQLRPRPEPDHRDAGDLATLAQFKVLSGTVPTAASLVDTGPISTVQAKLGTMSGDARWR